MVIFVKVSETSKIKYSLYFLLTISITESYHKVTSSVARFVSNGVF